MEVTNYGLGYIYDTCFRFFMVKFHFALNVLYFPPFGGTYVDPVLVAPI